MIERDEPFALTGFVVTEVLQGLVRDAAEIERYLSLWDLLEPGGFSTYSKTASIFRLARSRGVTITTIDALLAAIALQNDSIVFTLDKEFTRIARLVHLRLYSFPR
jgi:predicted nucleic acid-binding protein